MSHSDRIRRFKVERARRTDPHDAVTGARHDDVLVVPLVELGEADAQDLLQPVAAPCGRVHAGHLTPVDGPQADVGARTRGQVALGSHKTRHIRSEVDLLLHFLGEVSNTLT